MLDPNAQLHKVTASASPQQGALSARGPACSPALACSKSDCADPACTGCDLMCSWFKSCLPEAGFSDAIVFSIGAFRGHRKWVVSPSAALAVLLPHFPDCAGSGPGSGRGKLATAAVLALRAGVRSRASSWRTVRGGGFTRSLHRIRDGPPVPSLMFYYIKCVFLIYYRDGHMILLSF